MRFAALRASKKTVLALALALTWTSAAAQPLRAQLESALATQPAPFTGFEAAAEAVPGESGVHKYLVLDFRFAEPQPEKQLQASIHRICQAVLLNRQLVQTLSADGFNRLAVAFDRESQYDCF